MRSGCLLLAMFFVCLLSLARGADSQEAAFLELPAGIVPLAPGGAAPAAGFLPPTPIDVVDQRPNSAGPVASTDVESASLLQQKLTQRDRLTAEIESLRSATKSPEMIAVSVEILEVSLTKMRKLGVDFAQFGPNGLAEVNLGNALASGQPQVLPPSAVAGFIDFLKDRNLAKVLENPTVVSTSGKSASLFVGGMIPLPAAPGSPAAVQFREYGTQLELLAESLGNNRVRLSIRPRLSSIDDSRMIEIEGHKVPSLRVWEYDTSFELAFGETLMLGGLQQDRIESVVREGGLVEEVVNEVMTWVSVRAEMADEITPPAVQVQGVAYEVGVK